MSTCRVMTDRRKALGKAPLETILASKLVWAPRILNLLFRFAKHVLHLSILVLEPLILWIVLDPVDRPHFEQRLILLRVRVR